MPLPNGIEAMQSLQDCLILMVASSLIRGPRIELGVYKGGSSLMLLAGASWRLDVSSPLIVGIDPYIHPSDSERPYHQTVVRETAEALYRKHGWPLLIEAAENVDPTPLVSDDWLLHLDSGHSPGEAEGQLRHWLPFSPTMVLIDDMAWAPDAEFSGIHALLRPKFRECSLRALTVSPLTKYTGGVWIRKECDSVWGSAIGSLLAGSIGPSDEKAFVDEY